MPRIRKTATIWPVAPGSRIFRRARDRQRGLRPRRRALGRAGRARASASPRRARSSRATPRRRRAGSRRRSAPTTRPSCTPRTSGASSHETADRRLVEVLTSEAPAAIHWLEELGVEFTRENGGYRLARCGGASRQRLLQVGDRTGHAITKALREAFEAGGGTELPNHAAARARAVAPPAGARRSSTTASTWHRRGHGRPRRRRPLLPGRPGARRALDEPSGRDRRGDARSRSRSAPRRATSTRSSTTRTAAPGRRTCRATRSPRRRAPTAPCC